MNRPALLMSFILLLASCQGRPKISHVEKATGATGTAPGQGNGEENAEGENDGGARSNPGGAGPGPGSQTPDNSNENDTNLVGSRLRFADGNALSAMYMRIFTPGARGFQHCAKQDYFYRSDCTSTVFTPSERPLMGIVDLHDPGRGGPNIRRPEDMTLNYMRTLRVALGRECTNLVALESVNMDEGKVALNRLIKAERPTRESLEEFFRQIIGVSGTGMAVSIGANDYVSAFNTYLGDKSDKAKRNDAYVGLCVSIAMDPQIFLY